MAEFCAKCEFFAKKYGMWFSDQHKQDACVTFCRTDLCYSELFLKAISRAMKSASKVKIGQKAHHMVLFLKRSRHLGYLDYVVCYSGSKAWARTFQA